METYCVTTTRRRYSWSQNMTLELRLYGAAFLSLGILDRRQLSQMATSSEQVFLRKFVNFNYICSVPESFSYWWMELLYRLAIPPELLYRLAIPPELLYRPAIPPELLTDSLFVLNYCTDSLFPLNYCTDSLFPLNYCTDLLFLLNYCTDSLFLLNYYTDSLFVLNF